MAEKKLSIAFVWHLHQPNYKDSETGMYLMPWVRLHAIKDYLDMLLILDGFPKIKQTFNIVPLLMDQIEDYAHNDAHDVHSALTVKDVASFCEQDKIFVLNSFFDANYNSMISVHPRYNYLYQKRNLEGTKPEDFSEQEYSDILMWFNLAWFDPSWREINPELRDLYQKQEGYTLQDRVRVIEIQREIMREILPTYKKRLEEGKIEITTSPYYHTILPLIIDTDVVKDSMNIDRFPRNHYHHPEDASIQIEKAIERFEEVFGQKPRGFWPSEQCISNRSLKMIKKHGFKWTISDEGVLAKSLNISFDRGFDGVLLDPYPLCRAYNFGKEKDPLRVVFRSAFLANLINFQYGAYEPKDAAEDLYSKLKTAQQKLELSPDNHHIAVIALDGENCWESYQKDGIPFLKHLYKLISKDDALEAVTVSDYMEKIEKEHVLECVAPGSWINRDFQMWIGDSVKNLAWDYLARIRKDLEKFSKEKHDKTHLSLAWQEFYVAQGSDWFWWFGEPNNSGQDELFDFLFRNHLKRIYKVLCKDVPTYLERPLETLVTKQSFTPKDFITPQINGRSSIGVWENAGYIQNVQGPIYNTEKLFNKIYFGNDKDKIYIRFDTNKNNIENMQEKNVLSQIMLYFQGFNNTQTISYVRMRQTQDYLPNILRYAYSHEIEIPIMRGNVLLPVFSKSMENFLWEVIINHDLKFAYNQVIEMAIPFDDLNIKSGDKVNLTILTGKTGIIDEIITKDKPISFIRP